MKLYTDKPQTAKLIELGFENPKMAYGSIIVVLPREIWETLGDNGKDK